MTNDPGQPGWAPQPDPYGYQPQHGEQPHEQPHTQPEHTQQYPPQTYGRQEYGQHQYGQESHGQDGYGQAQQYGQPQQYGEPQYGQAQQYGEPQYGQQEHLGVEATQQFVAPPPAYPATQQYGAPQYGAPPTQQYSAQEYGTQQYAAQQYAAPPTQQFTGPDHPLDDPYGRPRHEPPEPPAKKKRTGIYVLAGVIALALCAGVGVAGGRYLSGDSKTDDASAKSNPIKAASGDPSPSTSPSEASESPSASSDKIASRDTDPRPVTVSELGSGTFSGSTGTFTKTGTDKDSDCGSAVDKDAGTLLADLGCSQVVSITAVNKDKDCVVTFGALNMPDSAATEKAIQGMRDGTAGSFVPRRHDKPAEGEAGNASWWFVMKAYGHYVTFATGAYADGKKVEDGDTTIVACDTDMLDEVHERLAERA